MADRQRAVSEEARLAWLRLMLTPGMGATRTARAVAGLGGAERVFGAPLTELERVGMPAKAAQFVADGRALAAAREQAAKTEEAGASFITREDAVYPERL